MIVSPSVLKSSNRVFYVLLSQKCDFQTGFFTMSFDPTHLVSQLTALNREDGDFRLSCDGLVVKAHSFVLSLRYGQENICIIVLYYIHPQVSIFCDGPHNWCGK